MRTTNGELTLTTEECWALLRTVSICRVAYSDRALPAIASVPFEVEDNRIVLLSPAGTGTLAAMPGTVIAFQAEQADNATGGAWSITCIGKPHWAPATQHGRDVLTFEPELLQGQRVAAVPVTRPANSVG
jgi:nitroimidazol reductase NimA-like FMN-containing flavoprotein (pyridoxamine 5'-phosphate oxidase superfamily)